MQTNINSIFANLMQVCFLILDKKNSSKKWISKHFRMLKGATPLLQRDRPLIFMLATKNILSSTFLSFFYDIIYMFMISIHSINHLKPFHFHLNSYKWWNYTLFVAVFVVTQTWPTFSIRCVAVSALFCDATD